MFLHTQFGETESDLEYSRQSLEQDLAYAKMMMDQPISDSEKERWQGAVDQISIQLSHIASQSGTLSDSTILSTGITTESAAVQPPLTTETPTTALTAGFDLSSLISSGNWPILAVIGVGLLLVVKGRKKKKIYGRRRKKRVKGIRKVRSTRVRRKKSR